MRKITAVAVVSLLFATGGCKTASGAADGVESAGSTLGSVATSLVNVDLSNVLNDVAVKLNVDKSNIPINAQIPITVAANVCGVSINILSIGAGGGSSKGCTATTASPELVQAVQQQLAANGSVGGGAQTGTTTAPTTSTTPDSSSTTTSAPDDGTASTPPTTPQ
jgi:hypothetical protein